MLGHENPCEGRRRNPYDRHLSAYSAARGERERAFVKALSVIRNDETHVSFH